jgi:CHAD domain-containing protein
MADVSPPKPAEERNGLQLMPQTSGSKISSRSGRAQPRHSNRLNPSMASDAAFRLLARRFLDDLAENHEATSHGDPAALHQMRIALTRLRTAISFFSPIADDPERELIKSELKWLNSHLGTTRDMDVMIERLKKITKQQPQTIQAHPSLERESAESHRRLTRALRSARYRRLIENTSRWVENGPWSTKKGKQAAKARTSPVAAFSACKLMRWREKLLKKSRELRDMGTKKRHRLRLANKRLYYSTEFFEDLFPDQKASRQQTALKYLRKAQKSLGQLNDDANSRSLAATLQQDGAKARLHFLGPKREERLVRTAVVAYRKLAELEPLRV